VSNTHRALVLCMLVAAIAAGIVLGVWLFDTVTG
jgi:hypothetical protein